MSQKLGSRIPNYTHRKAGGTIPGLLVHSQLLEPCKVWLHCWSRISPEPGSFWSRSGCGLSNAISCCTNTNLIWVMQGPSQNRIWGAVALSLQLDWRQHWHEVKKCKTDCKAGQKHYCQSESKFKLSREVSKGRFAFIAIAYPRVRPFWAELKSVITILHCQAWKPCIGVPS